MRYRALRFGREESSNCTTWRCDYGNLEVPVAIRDTPHNGKAIMTYVTGRGEILKEPVVME